MFAPKLSETENAPLWLDLWPGHPYLKGTMLRQLLTFFALLTGLAATAAPAEARIIGAETHVEAAFEIVVIADRRQQQAALAPVPHLVEAVRSCDGAPAWYAPVFPGVRVGIDRARE